MPSDAEQMAAPGAVRGGAHAAAGRGRCPFSRSAISAPGSPTLRCGRNSARLLRLPSSTRATWASTSTARRRCNIGTPQDPLGWGTDPAQEGWLTLRYRKVYREYLEPNKLTLPLILTEIGIDGLVGNRPGPEGAGWQDFGDYWDELGMGKDAPGNYMEQLAWYDASLQQDSVRAGRGHLRRRGFAGLGELRSPGGRQCGAVPEAIPKCSSGAVTKNA